MLDVMKTLALILVSSMAVAQPGETYRARLTPTPVDAAMRTSATGSGSASATLTGSKLAVSGVFEGLGSPAAVARLYAGPATGVRGAAIAELTVSKSERGKVTGPIDLAPVQMEALRKGRLYLQLATEKSPDGAIWGWLLR